MQQISAKKKLQSSEGAIQSTAQPTAQSAPRPSSTSQHPRPQLSRQSIPNAPHQTPIVNLGPNIPQISATHMHQQQHHHHHQQQQFQHQQKQQFLQPQQHIQQQHQVLQFIL